MVTYLFSYRYVIVQDTYFSLFAMGFVTVYGMFCIQHFLTEQSGNSIQEPTNTKDLSCNALTNKHTVNECDVRCPVFTKFRASSSRMHPEIKASVFLSCHLSFLSLYVRKCGQGRKEGRKEKKERREGSLGKPSSNVKFAHPAFQGSPHSQAWQEMAKNPKCRR